MKKVFLLLCLVLFMVVSCCEKKKTISGDIEFGGEDPNRFGVTAFWLDDCPPEPEIRSLAEPNLFDDNEGEDWAWTIILDDGEWTVVVDDPVVEIIVGGQELTIIAGDPEDIKHKGMYKIATVAHSRSIWVCEDGPYTWSEGGEVLEFMRRKHPSWRFRLVNDETDLDKVEKEMWLDIVRQSNAMAEYE